MRVLFISKELHQTAGSGVGARMHLDSIKRIVGEENVYVIDLDVNIKPKKEKNYISFGKYPSRLNRILRHIEGNTYYFSNQIIDEIIDFIKSNEINKVFIDDSYFGRLAETIKKRCPKVNVVAFFHDVKAELFKIWLKKANLIDKWDYSIAIKNERLSTQVVDANIVLNKEENELLEKYYGRTADYYLPVCVDKTSISSDENPYKTNKKHILFVGTKYLPNQNAVRWFSREILPQVRDSYDFWVVGKGLECLRDEIDDSDVHIVGFAESLEPFYSFTDIVIAPLVDGGGMKIKTAEAFAYGKVFLGSSESLHGYYDNLSESVKEKIVFQCDEKEEYLEALQKLSNEEILKRNQDLVSVYEEHYSPDAAERIMRDILLSN